MIYESKEKTLLTRKFFLLYNVSTFRTSTFPFQLTVTAQYLRICPRKPVLSF